MRNGVKLENTLAGAIGISAVVLQFFKGPQNQVTKSLGDYVQIQIINNTYTLISQAWNTWDNAKGEGTYTLAELGDLMKLIVDNSIRLTSEIESKIGEVEAPDLKVTSLTLDPEKDPKVGEELKVEAKVTNIGTKSGTETFTLLLDGEETDKKEEFTLKPGEMKSHTFTLKPDKAKEYTVKVGDLTKSFAAREKIKVSELKADPVDGDPSKRQLSAKFTNPNNAAYTDEFQITLNGKSLEEKWSVELQANEAKTLTKTISVSTDKEQKVKIGDVEVTFTL
jgi:hypothetical protein